MWISINWREYICEQPEWKDSKNSDVKKLKNIYLHPANHFYSTGLLVYNHYHYTHNDGE